MKFSVKSLLATTLLIALVVNGFIVFSQLTTLQIQNAKLQSVVATLRTQTTHFPERKLLYERAFEATEKRKKLLEKYERALNHLSPFDRSAAENQ